MKEYDIVVLGAGPGGYVSAIRAAQLGAKTAIIEQDKVGGVCLNAGCIPTKALMKNVEILHYIEQGKTRGIQVGDVKLDLKRAVKNKDKAVKQLVNGVKGLLMSNGVDIYTGFGTVKEGKRICIETSDSQESMTEIAYNKLIIATGSKAAMPPIQGIETEGVITSTEALQMTEAPERLVIVGGGVIGCELATIFSAYGSKVTIVELMDSLGSGLDEDMSAYLKDLMESQGVDIRLEHKANKIAPDENGGLMLFAEDKDGIEEAMPADKLLISVGRKTNLAGLEALDLEMDKSFIKINDYMETSVSDVYAIGDVTGKRQLAHVAEEMGIAAVENAVLGTEATINYQQIPACIYTIPEMASIGCTEQEAKKKGYDIVVGKFPLMACGKAVAVGDSEGIFKIIAEKDTERIIGAHLIGKSATELIAEVAAYMKMGATLSDVVETIHAHPTISESIAEAARCAKDGCIHMPKGYRG